MKAAKELHLKQELQKFESFLVGYLGNNKPEIGRAIITHNYQLLKYCNLKLKKQNRNMPINLLEKPGTQSP